MNLQWSIDIRQQHRIELGAKAVLAALRGETRLSEIFRREAEREGARVRRLIAEQARHMQDA